jgi:hypothetical protein
MPLSVMSLPATRETLPTRQQRRLEKKLGGRRASAAAAVAFIYK